MKRQENKICLARDKSGNSISIFEGGCARKVAWEAISVEIRDGDSCGSKEARDIDVLETMEAPLLLPERRLLQGGSQPPLSGNKLQEQRIWPQVDLRSEV